MREARSPQRRRAQRVQLWRAAAGGSTMNMLTLGDNGDEDEWQTFGGDPRPSCARRLRPNGLRRPRAGQEALLANIGWDENVAVSNLTKVLLEEELGYERVEISTSEDLDTTYRDVARGELDAFQDVWLPNQEALLDQIAEDVGHLDPWFLGETKQGMAVPAYMDVKSIEELNGTDAEFIFGLKQKLVTAPTAGMLAEVDRLYTFKEEFIFLAWSPHWMTQRYKIRYLEDPKDAMGPTNDPAECSTIVRGGLREKDPVAYAF